jgi:hypothetical protein
MHEQEARTIFSSHKKINWAHKVELSPGRGNPPDGICQEAYAPVRRGAHRQGAAGGQAGQCRQA